MIKVIFFDIGGVYVKHTNDSTMERMSKELGISEEDLKESLKDIRKDFQTGKIESEKYIEIASGRLGVTPSELERLYRYEEDFEIIPEVHEIILKLKRNGYFVATITDTSPFNLKIHIKKETYKVFDAVFDSVSYGAWKRDGELFNVALRELKVSADECIIIDNDEDKLVQAIDLGFNTVLYTGVDSLIEKLRNFGIRV
jgi:HAD superfamily hydrolase (TIGR01509 family)